MSEGDLGGFVLKKKKGAYLPLADSALRGRIRQGRIAARQNGGGHLSCGDLGDFLNDEATCGAFGVVVSAGGAVIPAEEDHLEVAFDPEFRGKEGAEVAFDGFWGISVGPVPSFGESHDVGVDGESGDVEDVREEDVCGFSSDAWERFECGSVAGDFAVVFLHEDF